MRLARIAVFVSVIAMGTATLHGQTAHAPSTGGCCTSTNCSEPCGDACCGQSGLLSHLHQAVGQCLAPLMIGCDARHKIYRAALCRNSFDKKLLLPLGAYSHILPCYSHNRCCCGPQVGSAGCPTCGPHAAVGEEIIEMQETPMPPQPEPQEAVEPTAQLVPGAIVPPKVARQQRKSRAAKPRTESRSDRVARSQASRTSLLSKILPPLPRTTAKPQPTVRQVSAVQRRVQPDPANPLR